MRVHLNTVTIICSLLVACARLGWICPVLGAGSIILEVLRCKKIASLTSDISADIILEFYRGDGARRYFCVESTVNEIRKFAANHACSDFKREGGLKTR